MEFYAPKTGISRMNGTMEFSGNRYKNFRDRRDAQERRDLLNLAEQKMRFPFVPPEGATEEERRLAYLHYLDYKLPRHPEDVEIGRYRPKQGPRSEADRLQFQRIMKEAADRALAFSIDKVDLNADATVDSTMVGSTTSTTSNSG